MIAFLGLRGAIVATILGALLIVASGIAGWQYVRAEAAVIAERDAKADRRDAEADLKVCVDANASAFAAEQARRDVAKSNAEALRAALVSARTAAEQAKRDKAASDALVRQWRKTWADRTATCAAALQTLDTACPELRRY